MNPMVYDDIWRTFLAGNHISRAPIWGGDGLALVAPVESPDVIATIERIQNRLAVHLPFVPHFPEALHLTIVRFCPLPDDHIPGLAAFLRAALAHVPGFPLELKRVNSFLRAPFLEVHPPAALDGLLACIQPGLAALRYPGMDYGPRGPVWHVTLGGYAEANDGAAARAVLRDVHEECAGVILVNELQLVKTSASAPYHLQILERYRLAEQPR